MLKTLIMRPSNQPWSNNVIIIKMYFYSHFPIVARVQDLLKIGCKTEEQGFSNSQKFNYFPDQTILLIKQNIKLWLKKITLLRAFKKKV